MKATAVSMDSRFNSADEFAGALKALSSGNMGTPGGGFTLKPGGSRPAQKSTWDIRRT